MKLKGLGDTIEMITKTLGVDKLVKSTGKECGCKKRKDRLNEIVSYEKIINELWSLVDKIKVE